MANVTLAIFLEEIQTCLELGTAGRLDNTTKATLKYDAMDDEGVLEKVDVSYKAAKWPIPPGPPPPP